MQRLVSAYYSASSSWTAPAGVTKVWVWSQGGGMGGSGGSNIMYDTANGGKSTSPYMIMLTVVPNTSYSITIGAGGTGGAARTDSTQNWSAGGNTTFGSLHTFSGAVISGTSPVIGMVQIPSAPTSGGSTHTGYSIGDFPESSYSGDYVSGTNGATGAAGSSIGVGGLANALGAGSAGTNATGFGAGGGGGGAGSTAGGVGGNGAPGQLWVIWVE